MSAKITETVELLTKVSGKVVDIIELLSGVFGNTSKSAEVSWSSSSEQLRSEGSGDLLVSGMMEGSRGAPETKLERPD